MNFLREAGRSIRDDDNSLKFILIDKNARKNAPPPNNIPMDPECATMPQTKATPQPHQPQQSPQPMPMSKDLDSEAEKQKMRKKLFWSRTTSNADSFAKADRSSADTPKKQQLLLAKSLSVDTETVTNTTDNKVTSRDR
jgi:hypothetical protein